MVDDDWPAINKVIGRSSHRPQTLLIIQYLRHKTEKRIEIRECVVVANGNDDDHSVEKGLRDIIIGKRMRQGGNEPPAGPLKGSMLPLHH